MQACHGSQALSASPQRCYNVRSGSNSDIGGRRTGDVVQRLYVIRNGRIEARIRVTDRNLAEIFANSITTMLKMSGVNDLYRLCVGQLTGELELFCVAFPRGYVPVSPEEFNKEGMNKEYDLGYKCGSEGVPCEVLPPGYRP